MADLASELYEKIKDSFERRYAQAQILGNPIGDIQAKINNGNAGFQDADMYAVEVGSMMADSMKEVLKLDELPGGRLIREVAKKTIGEGLKDTYGIISNVTATIQEELNEQEGIGLKTIKPKLEGDRVDMIVNRASNARTQQALDNNLTDSVPTFARQVVDDTQKANARLHNKAGLSVKVEREYDQVGLHDGTDVCDFCLKRAGTWTYDKAMANGVFERHEGCGCIITYTSAKGEVTQSTGKYSGFNVIDNPKEQENAVIKETSEPFTNVTAEYIRNATPGKGTITYQDGYDERKRTDEIRVGRIIYDTYGGELVFLREDDKQHVQTPDYQWNGKLWELKSPKSTKKISKRLEKGLRQINENPGGVIIDLDPSVTSIDAAIKCINGRMKASNKATTDIILLKDGKISRVLRYKK